MNLPGNKRRRPTILRKVSLSKKEEEKRRRTEEIEKLIAESSTSTPIKNNTDLHVNYNKLLDNHNKLKKQLQLTRSKLRLTQKQLRYYKIKYYAATKTPEDRKEQSTIKVLKNILTANQISILLNKKKRVNWNNEEIAIAFTLRYLSQKSYRFLRTKLNFPLPALSTLRKWASKISLESGVLNDILTFLQVAGENMSDKDRTVVLSFSEMTVKPNSKHDRDKLMQVVMVRSLFSRWKQPVYINFDEKMTKSILDDIIVNLHSVSYNCVAIVSDCKSSELWNYLGVDMNKTYFAHPITEKNVYVFADAPHLLQLLRNCFIETGFSVNDKIRINKVPLESLLDVTSCKISKKHLIVEHGGRQDVKLAAELLSHTTAQALIKYKPGPDEQLAEDVGIFIQDVNSWFDIFNSSLKTNSNSMKAPYGMHIDIQEEQLNKVNDLISCLRVDGKDCLETFQIGMVMSIKSLKSLFNNLKEQFEDFHYLCTQKLNLDCLENLFLQVRCGGSNQHPTSLQALQRIRMIILGNNPGVLEAQVNTQEIDREYYVVAQVLEVAEVHFETNDKGNETVEI